jgi:DNA-binding response OmpR family regulator
MGSILLVEAEQQCDRSEAAVRRAGHDVVVAISARDAFSRTSEGGIDAIVVDGEPAVAVELARMLHALPDPPPLVLVSSSPAAPEISARVGAAGFLPKPFEGAELVAIIARYVAPRPVRMFEPGDDEPTILVRDI